MLNKLVRVYICIFAVSVLFVGCSGNKNKNKNQANTANTAKTEKALDHSSETDNKLEFSNQQLNYQIKKLNAEMGMTVILVEQKLPIARRVADKFVILDRGANVYSGLMDELDDKLIKKYLTV